MVEHDGEQFSVLVGSACSGVNTLVGFLVVGIFGLYFVRGAAGRRLLWLVVGAALVWSFNVVRILGILAVGKSYGERAAFEVLHPVAGLLALNAAALVLVLLMRPFGLRWRRAVEVDSPLAEPGEPQERATPARFLRRFALLAVRHRRHRTRERHAAGRGTRAHERRSAGGGAVHRQSRSSAPAGRPSRWRRSAGRPPITASTRHGSATGCGRAASNSAAFTIWLDAVRSPDLGALNAYTLAHCYDFHDFDVNLARRVDLSDGVIGQAFVYDTPRATWHVVSWQWPVLLDDGRAEHERIVMLASTGSRPETVEDGSGGVRRLAALAPRPPRSERGRQPRADKGAHRRRDVRRPRAGAGVRVTSLGSEFAGYGLHLLFALYAGLVMGHFVLQVVYAHRTHRAGDPLAQDPRASQPVPERRHRRDVLQRGSGCAR